MRLLTCTGYPDDKLESYRPADGLHNWELVISGYWSEGTFHSGYIAYFIQQTSPGTWVMNTIERNAVLDDVTEEDVEEGRLNDDQIQAMWGTTLEEAQSQTYERIVAVLLDASTVLTAKDAAMQMYEAVQADDGKFVDEPTKVGLLG